MGIEASPVCKNCHLNVHNHGPGGKCLFEPTNYEELRMTSQLDEIVEVWTSRDYVVSRRMVTRKPWWKRLWERLNRTL